MTDKCPHCGGALHRFKSIYHIPEREPLLHALLEVNEAPRFRYHFYPVLLELAGKEVGFKEAGRAFLLGWAACLTYMQAQEMDPRDFPIPHVDILATFIGGDQHEATMMAVALEQHVASKEKLFQENN